MAMESKLRNVLLVAVDSFLLFAIVAVLPFAWMLRDGMGPDSVSTTGLAALSRTFMTFYVGPAILLLASFDLLLRRRTHDSIVSGKAYIVPVVIMLILVALGAVAFHLPAGH